MIAATTDDLLTYVADTVGTAERFGATIVQPNRSTDTPLRRYGELIVLRIHARLPAAPRNRDVDIVLTERWTPTGAGPFALHEYGYELRNRQLNYRRALHRHDVDHFMRAFDVATHEHCETPLGYAACEHYHGPPVDGAIDGFLRLYEVWLAGVSPDCTDLRCLK